MDTGRRLQERPLGAAGLFDLSGKVAVVTGSGRGLGKVMAQGLAAAGAAVVTSARTPEEAEQVAGEILGEGGTAAATRVDVSDRKSCEDLISFAVEQFGRVDVFVNNAAVEIVKPVAECTDEDLDQTLDTNVKGYFRCAQLAGIRMIEQGTGGSIINVSSIASVVAMPGCVAYGASKNGVNQLTRVMAREWAPQKVRVNAIAPGYMDNAMRSGYLSSEETVATFTPMARRGRPEELIGPAVFLACDASSYVTGTVLFVDGGRTAM